MINGLKVDYDFSEMRPVMRHIKFLPFNQKLESTYPDPSFPANIIDIFCWCMLAARYGNAESFKYAYRFQGKCFPQEIKLELAKASIAAGCSDILCEILDVGMADEDGNKSIEQHLSQLYYCACKHGMLEIMLYLEELDTRLFSTLLNLKDRLLSKIWKRRHRKVNLFLTERLRALLKGSSKSELVLFYADWCAHSRNMLPEWKKAKELLYGKVSAIEINDGKIALERKVIAFPTIRLYPLGFDSFLAVDYKISERTCESFVEFALGNNNNMKNLVLEDIISCDDIGLLQKVTNECDVPKSIILGLAAKLLCPNILKYYDPTLETVCEILIQELVSMSQRLDVSKNDATFLYKSIRFMKGTSKEDYFIQKVKSICTKTLIRRMLTSKITKITFFTALVDIFWDMVDAEFFDLLWRRMSDPREFYMMETLRRLKNRKLAELA